MKLVNLTPHDVNIIRDMGDLIIRPSGIVARIEVKKEVVADLDGVPVTYNDNGPVTGLPDPEPGTLYIVSNMTAQAARDRYDLLVPDDPVRNPAGVVLGCRSLATMSKEVWEE